MLSAEYINGWKCVRIDSVNGQSLLSAKALPEKCSYLLTLYELQKNGWVTIYITTDIQVTFSRFFNHICINIFFDWWYIYT